MAKQRTEKSKYKSPSTAVWVTPAQYIAEIMCQRKADRHNDGKLPFKFWNTSKWKTEFRHQITQANAILKRHNHVDVINGLNSYNGSKIYSLRFPGLNALITKEKRKRETKEKVVAQPPPKPELRKTAVEPGKPFQSKKSNLGMLRRLDGEKKGEEGKG